MDNDGLRPQDYLAILWRRKWLIILPFLLLFSASFALALLLPREYRSSATILIEEADVPSELVTSTITGFADQRLQVISQRVMATQNLLEIIRKYDLYAEARRVQPVSEVVERMREKIKMDLVSAEVRDPQSGRAGEATIAFTVSFDHR
ncbi:MAG: Wzz/FepE/Etk N-terminal domain-containing protein, partial [Rhodospirillales bacterium]|nr:Wzz/FepE/Etk N-terminal domain-containing protein [Rhodospirillales bacterium]